MPLVKAYIHLVFPEAHRVCEKPFGFRNHYFVGRMVKNPKKSNSPRIEKPYVQDLSSFLIENPQRVSIWSLSSEVVIGIDEEFVSPYFCNYPSIPAEDSSTYRNFLAYTLERKHTLTFNHYDGMCGRRRIGGAPPKKNSKGTLGDFSAWIVWHWFIGRLQQSMVLSFLRGRTTEIDHHPNEQPYECGRRYAECDRGSLNSIHSKHPHNESHTYQEYSYSAILNPPAGGSMGKRSSQFVSQIVCFGAGAIFCLDILIGMLISLLLAHK